MAKLQRVPLLAELFAEIAPRIGATLLVEPNWGIAGQIAFPSGRKRYFRFSSIDLNSLGSSEVAKDKDYANFFMRSMGYETIPGDTFYSPAWGEAIGVQKGFDEAYLYARELGFPVMVKPNSGSQGRNVAVAGNKRELRSALKAAFTGDRVALVQKVISGRDYRIVVLDDDVISAYERIPLNVVGDGGLSINELMETKQRQFVATGRDTVLKMDDPRIDKKIGRYGMSRTSVPQKGETVYLLDNANLSSGGDAVDVTSGIHPSVAALAVKLTKDMGLRLCGVDLLIPGPLNTPLASYSIIEINAAPGLDHYAQVGSDQKSIVEAMYLRVLQSMDRD